MAVPGQTADFSPLQVPEVLKTIFEGSSLDDLKEFRKVCQSWNLESSKVLSKSALLQIGGGPHQNPTPEKRLEKFMAVVDDEMCTFTKKACFPESVHFCFPDHTEYDARFWRRFGCHIKNFKLGDAHFPSSKDFCLAIFESCPNLEKLEMRAIRLLGVDGQESSISDDDFLTAEEDSNAGEDAKTDNDSNDYPQRGDQSVNKNLKFLGLWVLHDKWFPSFLLKRLFNHFPNLEVLHVGCSSFSIFLTLKDRLQGGDGRGDKLKELGISFNEFDDSDVMAEILTTGKLRLEKLGLWNCIPRHTNAARTMLEGHAATLKKFNLSGVGNYVDSAFALSNGKVLGELEEMELSGGNLKSTNFWKCVPNLKKLVLKCTHLSRVVTAVSVQELRNVALNSCDEVNLEFCSIANDDDQAEVVRKLTALLPNVRKVKLEHSKSQLFAIVCQAFPNLVELIVSTNYGRQIYDSDITGLDAELVEKINREGENGDWKPKSEQRAGIAKLKDLKVLSIQNHQGFGYSSAVSGIQRLAQLEQLQLDFQEVEEETWTGVWKPLLVQFPWRGN